MNTDKLNTTWRKLSTAIYSAPRDGRTHGGMDIDITKSLEFIQKHKEKGVRITVTHLVAAALGKALGYDIPEMNSYVRRGKLLPREDVVVMLAINMGGGGEMGSIRIRNAHNKSVFDIADEVQARVDKTRSGKMNKSGNMKKTLAGIPWPIRSWLFNLIRFITGTLGIDIKSLGIGHDTFGSILLTNIGSHGLTRGTAALFPGSNLAAVIILGKAEDKPVVRDGEIVIRTMLPLNGTFDHRISDGYHGGRLAAAAIKYLENPELLAKRNPSD